MVPRRSSGWLLAWLVFPVLFFFVCSVGTFQDAGRFGTGWGLVLIPWGLVFLGCWVAPAASLPDIWADPLGLSEGSLSSRAQFRRWLGKLPWMVFAVALISGWLSPVSRAGLFAIALMPAYVLLPAALAELWRPLTSVRGRLATEPLVLAMTGFGGCLAGLALWQSLRVWQGFEQGSRVALPLGHHNLQAAVTVALWPFALLVLARRSGRGRPASLVLVSVLALGLQLLVVAGTRSLGAALAVAVQMVLLIWLVKTRSPEGDQRWSSRSGRSGRGWLAALLALLVLLLPLWLLLPRLLSVVAGRDSSALARFGYWRGALAGFVERPLLGWGPGSSHWTLAEHLTPIPGVHPPGEIVADPHSLPLLVAYELGAPGLLLLALIVLLVLSSPWRRPQSRHEESEVITLELAAWLGMVGVAMTSLFLAAPSVAAPGMIVVMLLALARLGRVHRRHDGDANSRRSVFSAARRGLAPGAFLVMLTIVLRPLLALGLYEEARQSWYQGETGLALELVSQARLLDPSFPLYGLRQALLMDELDDGDPEEIATLALQAAVSARGLAPLWLSAAASAFPAEPGDYRRLEVDPELLSTLERACALAPLEGVAPLLAGLLSQDRREVRLHLLARAVLAEPGFLAALSVSSLNAAADGDRPRVLGVVDGDLLRDHLLSWPDIPDGLKVAFDETLSDLVRSQETDEAQRQRVRLAFAIDQDAATSLSLHAFRRQPWPGVLARVEIDEALFDALDEALPRATVLRETGPAAFTAEDCRVITSSR